MYTRVTRNLFMTLIMLVALAAISVAINQEFNFQVADGVSFKKWQTDTTGVIRNISILKIDYQRKDVELTIATGSVSREHTSSIAKRNHALAAINGGYFNMSPTGGHVGMVMQNGTIIHGNVTSVPPRGAIGFSSTHRIVLDRVETPEDKSLKGVNGTDWSDITEALAGGPVLVFAGATVNWWKEESMGASFNSTNHPRTAIGYTKDTVVYMVVVDGRQPGLAVGISLDELSQFMLDLGCDYALNLDGGGSSTMVVLDTIMNSVSDGSKDKLPGTERPVTNTIILKKKD